MMSFKNVFNNKHNIVFQINNHYFRMNTKALFPLLHIDFSTQVSFTNPYKNPKMRNGETALGMYLNWQSV